jgi:hypothetical protein
LIPAHRRRNSGLWCATGPIEPYESTAQHVRVDGEQIGNQWDTIGLSDEQDDLARRLELLMELLEVIQLEWLETVDFRRALQQSCEYRKIPLPTLPDGNTMLVPELSGGSQPPTGTGAQLGFVGLDIDRQGPDRGDSDARGPETDAERAGPQLVVTLRRLHEERTEAPGAQLPQHLREPTRTPPRPGFRARSPGRTGRTQHDPNPAHCDRAAARPYQPTLLANEYVQPRVTDLRAHAPKRKVV